MEGRGGSVQCKGHFIQYHKPVQPVFRYKICARINRFSSRHLLKIKHRNEHYITSE